jgi:hypothetical protein
VRVEYVGGGSVPLRNLRIADFNQFNAATYLDAAGVEDLGPGLGWQVPVLGGVGKDVTDPFSGFHMISKQPLQLDAFGSPIDATWEWDMQLGLHEVTNPNVNNQNIDFLVGLCSEAADSGTIGALGDGFGNAAANRVCRTAVVTAGVATLSAGTTLNTIRRFRGMYYKRGTGTSMVLRVPQRFMDANNAALAAASSSTAGTALTSNDGPVYMFVAVYRTSTTDPTARTLVFQPVWHPPIQHDPSTSSYL